MGKKQQENCREAAEKVGEQGRKLEAAAVERCRNKGAVVSKKWKQPRQNFKGNRPKKERGRGSKMRRIESGFWGWAGVKRNR